MSHKCRVCGHKLTEHLDGNGCNRALRAILVAAERLGWQIEQYRYTNDAETELLKALEEFRKEGDK